MNFKTYFKEGLVKIPDSLANDMLDWVEKIYYSLQWNFAYTANDFMDNVIDREEIDRFYEAHTSKRLLDEIDKKYGRNKGIVRMRKEFPVPLSELEYDDLGDERLSGDDPPTPYITLYLEISPDHYEQSGNFSTASGGPMISIEVPEKEVKTSIMNTFPTKKQADDLLDKRNHEVIKWALQETEGILVHELTHYLEVIIRGTENWKRFAGDATRGSAGMDYVLNPAEFEPVMQEIFSVAKNIVEESGPITKDEFKKAMNGNWKELAGKRGVSGSRVPDQRLRAFKANEPDTWKRAVQKLFNALQEREMIK